MIARIAGVNLLLLALEANGADRLVLYDTSQHGLAAAIRIQLGAVVEVIDAPALDPGNRVDRIAFVRGDLTVRGARLGLWVETATIVCLVGDRPGQPFIETASIAGVHGPDLERALALKVLELLDPIRSDLSRPAPEAGASPRFRFSLEAGAVGAIGDGDGGPQAGLLVAVGGRLEPNGWLVELRTGFHVVSTLDEEDESRGRIALSEWSWIAGLRVLLGIERWWFGPALDMNLRVLDAQGTTQAGAQGEVSFLLPSLILGAEVRAPLWRMLHLRALAGAGLNVEHRQLALNEAPLLDVGRWYGTLQLSLVFSVP